MLVDPEELAATLISSGGGSPAPADFRTTLRRKVELPGLESLPRFAVAPTDGATAESGDDLSLETLIGRGGMGEVWLARQRSLRRLVALKRPRSDSIDDGSALVAEARVSGGLEHPHIVPIHVLGLDEAGRPVLVMKRIAGSTLAALCDDDAHPAWPDLRRRHGDRESAIIETLMKVADALDFAHSRGVIHRDVKPENVMVGEFGEVYLLDWGVAHELGHAFEHGLVGTPAFLAPEMVSTSLGPIDVRTDVYLLGATLHAALTRRARHEGATLAQVLLAAMESAPVDYGDRLSSELTSLCNRATAKRPEHRFPTAAAFRDELGHVLRQRTMTRLADGIAAKAAPALEPGRLPAAVRSRTLMEARFALAPLLVEWPSHLGFRALHDQVLRALVDAAIDLRALPEAEDAFTALSTPDAALALRIRALTESLRERARLAAYGEAERKERAIAPGFRGLAALVALIGIASVFVVVWLSGTEEPPMRMVLLTDFVGIAFVAVGAYFFRASLLANRRTRGTVASVFLLLSSMGTSDVLSAFMGLTSSQAAPYGLLMMAVGFAAMTVLLDAPRRLRLATGACSVLVAVQAFWSAAAPERAAALVSLATVEAMFTAAYLLWDMAKERRAAPSGP